MNKIYIFTEKKKQQKNSQYLQILYDALHLI